MQIRGKKYSKILLPGIILFILIMCSYHFGIKEVIENNSDFIFKGEKNDAFYFIKYGYPEIKSLSFQFLTLISGILVFTISFSEKIVKLNDTSNIWMKILFSYSWALLILALIFDGLGIAFNGLALPNAIVDSREIISDEYHRAEFYNISIKSIRFIMLSGFTFILGLILLSLTAVMKFIQTDT